MQKAKYIILSAFLVLGFQNCAKQGFSQVTAEAAGVVDAGDGAQTVCDPFSDSHSSSDCSEGEGLLGNVYYYLKGVGVQNYIDKGTLLPIYVQMSNLDIPLRSWLDGFPGPDGTQLKQSDGTDLNEYFALNLKGYLMLNSKYSSGQYEFAIASDDGSILNIDGQEVVNNDGTHSVTWACSGKSVQLTEGSKHSIQVRYYQGPRYYIALQVFWRPASMHNKPCNSTGGWTVVPSDVLFH
ncbi:PA14 domain-containing protein [Bdellovibrio sp. SKB1291214]|uniref:PA14 domain-containing protein n=1 Tax=Bdellovibrio sp. SKB1291214 TaxID=1732569 RepID=UPI000B51666C|nr:PA14 domain-containing protein [Bdellovibrio sp. SKB1291214]UYL08379.1 PA14 domain-containing protein [Bdellovibrio sp. SKB1291214]